MKETKINSRALKKNTFVAGFTAGFLDIHKHRYFRRIFCALLICHILSLMIPDVDRPIEIPIFLKPYLEFLYRIWPFPTAKLADFFSDNAYIYIRNILFKSFEILVLLLYTVDLLPKIFVWKKPLLWKLINIFVVTMMVIQVPLIMSGYIESGFSIATLKVRTFSIGLSFLFLLEILSIREQRHMKIMKNSNNNTYLISNYLVLQLEIQLEENLTRHRKLSASLKPKEDTSIPKLYSWAEIIKHDKPGFY